MSVFKVMAAVPRGSEAAPVLIEAELNRGMIPTIDVVGTPDPDAVELRSLVRTALRSCGYDVPRTHVTVCVSPTGRAPHCSGRALALPVAAAVLGASGQIPEKSVEGRLLMGSLRPDGGIAEPRGAIAAQLLARDLGLEFVGSGSPSSLAACPGASGITSLSALRDPNAPTPLPCPRRGAPSGLDLADVPGNGAAKRAMAVAAAGGHGLLLVGEPSGTARDLAMRMTTILPALSEEERERLAAIHSVAGEDVSGILSGQRPFRGPCYAISTAGLIGGGRPVRPGEVTLADGGVLFLEGLNSFATPSLQMLRRVVEDRSARIVRVDGLYEMPASFALVAAEAPCPCGGFGTGGCRCTAQAIERWQARMAGPLSDLLEVRAPAIEEAASAAVRTASSAEIREQVKRAESFRAWRENRDYGGGPSTADRAVVDAAARALGLTDRQAVSISRVARTVADMAESAEVSREHVLEAASLRGAMGSRSQPEGVGLDALERECSTPAAGWLDPLKRGGEPR